MSDVTNLYLERLKRLTDEELREEVNKMGRRMEEKEPLTKSEKQRMYMAFRMLHGRTSTTQEDKQMLQVALRVLKLL